MAGKKNKKQRKDEARRHQGTAPDTSSLDDLHRDPQRESPSCIVFKVRLPFALPLAEDRLHLWPLRLEYQDSRQADALGPPWVRLQLAHVHLAEGEGSPAIRPGLGKGLSRLGRDSTLQAEFPSPSGRPFPEVQTWIEVATPFALLDGELGEDLLTASFERCLRQVNHLIRAFLIVAPGRAFPVNKEILDPFVMYEFEDPESEDRSDPGMMMLHTNFSDGGAFELLPEREESLVYTCMESIAFRHPFTRHREWLERAKHCRYKKGDYEEAVFALQVSVECLLSGLAYITGVDDNLSSDEIDQRTAEMTATFASLVKVHLPAVLGGSWSLTGPGAAAMYWRDLYELRNSLTHAGTSVSYVTVEAAFASFDGLIDFVVGRLLAQPRRYPRSLLCLLGEPGLRRRGAWSTHLRTFAGALDDEPYPFWAPHDVVGRKVGGSSSP